MKLTEGLTQLYRKAVVTGYQDEIDVLILMSGNFTKRDWIAYSLRDGISIGYTVSPLIDCTDIGWVINPGDKCLARSIPGEWKEITFSHFNGQNNFPFTAKGSGRYAEIKPLNKKSVLDIVEYLTQHPEMHKIVSDMIAQEEK